MKCYDCTAEKLTGRSYEFSEFCDGPVDGEFMRDGDLVLSFKAVCHAVLVQQRLNGRYRSNELHLRPAVDTQDTIIDLTETIVHFPHKT